MSNSKLRSILLGTALVAPWLTGCGFFPSLFNPPIDHLALGNPSQATAEVEQPNNYLIRKPQYALSYNNSKGIPNWVSWHLDQSWLGNVERQDDFRPDDILPEGWTVVTPNDYTNSGYDRGHLIPAGDRTKTEIDNSATFYMTNVVPQKPGNNRGPWLDLENYCRELVEQGKELYMIAGGYGQQEAIAAGKISPPSHLWKVIVVLDQPGQGFPGITNNTRVIAVDMPNQQGIRTTDWQTFRVSVDSVESKTGYDFLAKVPAAVQQTLESGVDQTP